MNGYLKQNWKYIAATAAGFVVVFGAIYYVNCVYLPNRALERAMAMDAETLAAERAAEEKAQNERTYSFNINTELGQRSDSAAVSDEGVTVTTDENGDIIVDRTWDEDTGDLPISAGPGSPIANIGGGGGEKITGEDGAYHGEQPAAQTPESGGSGSGTEADSKNDGKTDSGKTGETPSTPSTPSSGTDGKPSSGGSSTGGSSTGGNSSSSKPKDGDRRVVNGQEQEYWEDVDTWVDVGDGGRTDYIDYKPDEGLSGIQVGSMG